MCIVLLCQTPHRRRWRRDGHIWDSSEEALTHHSSCSETQPLMKPHAKNIWTDGRFQCRTRLTTSLHVCSEFFFHFNIFHFSTVNCHLNKLSRKNWRNNIFALFNIFDFIKCHPHKILMRIAKCHFNYKRTKQNGKIFVCYCPLQKITQITSHNMKYVVYVIYLHCITEKKKLAPKRSLEWFYLRIQTRYHLNVFSDYNI